MNEIYEKILIKIGKQPDFSSKKIKLTNVTLNLTFCSPIISDFNINEFLPRITNVENIYDIENYFKEKVPLAKFIEVTNFTMAESLLFGGFILINVGKYLYGFESRGPIDRSISESTTEVTIHGSKEALNESYNSNIALVRKRIKSLNLNLNEHIIGRYTKTRIGILSIKNISSKELIADIEKRLSKIDIDGIFDSHYIEELIIPEKDPIPTCIKTEKPDLVCEALLEGKVVIITENSPVALIIPSLFIDFFHVPEDYYQKSINVSFTRMIRIFAFFTAIILPGLYLGITTYNPEIIPTKLFLAFASQRSSIAFPSIAEALFMILAFEIIKESDTRFPSSVGSALSIVGGLVLGEAAVSAGLVSPIMIIVIAISTISGLVFSNMDMINAIRFYRLIFIAFALLLGTPGIYIGIIFFILKISSMNTFGKPFLYPFAPLYLNKKDVIFRQSRKKLNKRDEILVQRNRTRYKEREI
ncbi:MAG: spore germination protein [Bacilli bacterium]